MFKTIKLHKYIALFKSVSKKIVEQIVFSLIQIQLAIDQE
jgi:hypothetical protein